MRRRPIRVRARCIVARGDALLLQVTPDGIVEVPGGRVEYDESIPFCLVREMREEAGVDVEPKDLVYIIEFRGEKRGRRRHEILFYFKCAMNGEPRPKERGLIFEWIPAKELRKRNFWPAPLAPYIVADMPEFPYTRFISIHDGTIEYIMTKTPGAPSRRREAREGVAGAH